MIAEDEVIIDESRKNNFLSLKDKAEILERLENGATASHLAREYGISKSTISRFKKRKTRIQEAVTNIYPNNTDRRTMRGTFHPKMEQALYKWYIELCNQHIDVSSSMLRYQAQVFYSEFQESNYSFSASTGWLKNFQKRFGIRSLTGDKAVELRVRKPKSVKVEQECETIEYLVETTDDCEEEEETSLPQLTQTIKPKDNNNSSADEEWVQDGEAYRCLETVIKWSMQRSVDTLYLTMLRNLKTKARNSKK